eukprot:2112833-Rhodomonas_salina.6
MSQHWLRLPGSSIASLSTGNHRCQHGTEEHWLSQFKTGNSIVYVRTGHLMIHAGRHGLCQYRHGRCGPGLCTSVPHIASHATLRMSSSGHCTAIRYVSTGHRVAHA